MVHFDPDAPEAKSLEVQKKEVDGNLSLKRKDIVFFLKKKKVFILFITIINRIYSIIITTFAQSIKGCKSRN